MYQTKEDKKTIIKTGIFSVGLTFTIIGGFLYMALPSQENEVKQIKEEKIVKQNVKKISPKLEEKLVKKQEKETVKEPKKLFEAVSYEYTVKSGDSLYKIAKQNNTTISKLKQINGLKSSNLKIGQKIIVK